MTQTAAPVITGIVVMVPEAYAVAPFAHITLLAPFGRDGAPTADELAHVERLCADVTPFDVTLSQRSTFPDGTCYLCPEPASAFSHLTHRLHRLFPEYPPYAGAFDLVVPHLTVPAEADLAALLPLHTRAREAALLRRGEDGCAVLARFAFGTSAA